MVFLSSLKLFMKILCQNERRNSPVAGQAGGTLDFNEGSFSCARKAFEQEGSHCGRTLLSHDVAWLGFLLSSQEAEGGLWATLHTSVEHRSRQELEQSSSATSSQVALVTSLTSLNSYL